MHATPHPSDSQPSRSPTSETIEQFRRYVIGNYNRYPVCLVRGEGSWIWDAEGKRYLDFFPGWGCNLLGHCPERVVEAVQHQVGQLIHVPNTWHMEAQGKFAEALSKRSFGGQCFFCNSGTEANEAAIKLARACGHARGRFKIITMERGFHGRTYGAMSATAQPKYHVGFEPIVEGFVYVPFNDLDAVAAAMDDQTAAVLVEPVQGEGGVHPAKEGYLAGLRQLCDERGVMLIFDEVQTAMGRLGTWFGYQRFNVVPDVLTIAKALAGGVAAGVMIAKPEYAQVLKPGMHACTFGGNPIACRAGLAVIETIEADGLLDRALVIGERFRARFEELQRRLPNLIRDVRALGVMVGVELSIDGAPIVNECLKRGLLINATQGQVLRLLPALTISDEQIDQGCAIIADVLSGNG